MSFSSTAKVLIVEDELMIRLAAVNADEAIKILEDDAQIRLVFTDIEMAGSMDGAKLAAYVRDRWPPVEIIVTSGRMSVNDITLPTTGTFLAKPYSVDELVSRVGALMTA